MAGGKLSARQKMINMMYLVLIAMLALNVSREILHSFYLIETSFNQSRDETADQNEKFMKGFQQEAANNPAKKQAFKAAQEVTSELSAFVKYIEDVKTDLETISGGRDSENAPPGEDGELKAGDDTEKHVRYFIKEEGGKRGKELVAKINQAREKVLKILRDTSVKVDPSTINQIASSTGLKTIDDPNSPKDWLETLTDAPLASVITNLSRLQADARTTESQAIKALSTDDIAIVIDKLEAKVIAPSSTVMTGQEYQADIILVASNSKADYQVVLDNGTEVPVEDGMGKFTATPRSQGFFDLKGVIKMNTDTGIATFPFITEYQAFAPQATISAEKMNMLYIGLDNPLSISVPGFSPSDVIVSGKGVRLTGSGGKRIAKVSRGVREATVSVAVKMKDGSTRSMGATTFRVRPVPKPEGQLGALPNDGIPKPKAQLVAQRSVIATMGPSFAYDLKWSVLEYKFIYIPRRQDARILSGRGGALTPQMTAILRNCRRGDRISIESIKAKERTTGMVKNIAPILITVR
jgi:gliding motility-associated protein GldM